MTLFPHTRRLMLASAVVVPGLFYAAFLCLARGIWSWGICAIVIGVVIGLMFPFGILVRDDRDHQANIRRESRAWSGGRIAGLGLYFWLFLQPEFHSLMGRITKEHALWNRWLIVPFGIATAIFMYNGVKSVRNVGDKAIYRYYAGRRMGSSAEVFTEDSRVEQGPNDWD